MKDNTFITQTDDTNNQNVTISSNSTNPDIIFCGKCGSEMKKNARYCMKCGNLNYDHPENEAMKQYATNSNSHNQFVSVSDNSLFETNITKKVYSSCLVTNFILHTLLACLFMFLFIENENFIAVISLAAVGTGLLFLYNYSMQCIFIKSDQPWWAYFIPLYNSYIFFEIAMSSGWLFLLSYIPIVGIIVYFVAYFKLGTRFYKNGILTALFPFVMIPIIGLDRNAQLSILTRKSGLLNTSVDSKGRTKMERDYRRKKTVLTTVILVLMVVGLYFGWPYIKPVLIKFYEFFMEQLEFFK